MRVRPAQHGLEARLPHPKAGMEMTKVHRPRGSPPSLPQRLFSKAMGDLKASENTRCARSTTAGHFRRVPRASKAPDWQAQAMAPWLPSSHPNRPGNREPRTERHNSLTCPFSFFRTTISLIVSSRSIRLSPESSLTSIIGLPSRSTIYTSRSCRAL